MSTSNPSDDFPSAGPRVLIVEDDAEVSQSVAQMLASLGYAPSICNNANDVLRYLQAHKVDLMLIDYRMPEMTGLDLILLLKQENCGVPVIMMTGYAETESRIPPATRREFPMLKKPFAASDLARAIEDSLATIRPATIGK